MAQELGDKPSDEQLCETLQRLPDEWNEHGVFHFVPRKHEGPIDYKSAEDILQAAIDIAVYKRLSHINS
jgi:hypothetical protein